MAAVSIIMPVFNGAAMLQRAIESVRAQTMPDWDMLAVDDCSSDQSIELLETWSRVDGRIRVLKTAENGGAGAARNVGLQQAAGGQICYLDCDDEYYPDYLQQLVRHRRQADVLVFGYDVINVDGSTHAWDPAKVQRELFLRNVSTPLGVSHPRKWVQRIGGFDERLWFEVDWDYWKRLARAGAEFAFLPIKSGRYYARAASQSRTRRLTTLQRENVERNRAAGKPIFWRRGQQPSRPVQSILFTATQCLLDSTSGAAVATRRMLDVLRWAGFHSRAYCGSQFDTAEEIPLDAVLKDSPGTAVVGAADEPSLTPQAELTVFRSASTRRGQMQPDEARAFLRNYQRLLDAQRPDCVITYGGDRLSEGLIDLAKLRDIPIVFALHNLEYHNPDTFRRVDYVIVPSQFARDHYWRTLGVDCQVLPNVIDPARVAAREGGGQAPLAPQAPQNEPVPARQREFLTFVTPQPAKGLFVFARIAEQLSLRRPDIPLLVVEGRAGADWRTMLGEAAKLVEGVKSMPWTSDPREYYGVTKLLLMPSLAAETFGLTAAEAMINGIPVLASNRGALPETLGDGGIVLDIPAHYTPKTATIPEVDQVIAWIEAMICLWDDADRYEQISRKARLRPEQWRPKRLAPLYEAFFRNVAPQPGPPLVPSREVKGGVSPNSGPGLPEELFRFVDDR